MRDSNIYNGRWFKELKIGRLMLAVIKFEDEDGWKDSSLFSARPLRKGKGFVVFFFNLSLWVGWFTEGFANDRQREYD